MIGRIIVSFAAIAVLFSASVVSASAQTAGTSTLEQIGYTLKQSYAFGLNQDGSSLSLRNRATGDVMTLATSTSSDVVLHAVLGNLSSLSKADRGTVRDIVSFINTSLPVGTIVIEKSGMVTMEHHMNAALVSVADMTKVISRFSDEAARRKAMLFS